MGDADPKASGEETGRFGGYVTGAVLGSGGMGTVYEARHPTLGKRVALKVIKGSLAGDPVARERFLREAQAIALIAHPNVVDVFDLGIDEERAFIVMERLEGETLEALLARKHHLAVTQAVDLLLPVISAAAAIHETGVVHRDLKPGNVMLARRGRFAVDPVVLDFGISRAHVPASPQDTLTEPQQLVGTVSYLSPEQLRDARAAGPQSDQYALGVMLYECVTGKKPFTGGDRYELIHAAMTAEVAPPSRVVAAIPDGFDAVVLRALDRRPESRFPSVRALGGALLSFADRSAWKRWASEFAGVDPESHGSGFDETAGDARSRPDPVSAGRGRRLSGVALAGAALALGAAALIARSRPQAAPPPPMRAPHAEVRPAAPAPTAPSARPPQPTAPPAVAEEPPAATRARSPKRTTTTTRAIAAAAAGPATMDDAMAPANTERNRGKSAENAQADDAIDPFSPVR